MDGYHEGDNLNDDLVFHLRFSCSYWERHLALQKHSSCLKTKPLSLRISRMGMEPSKTKRPAPTLLHVRQTISHQIGVANTQLLLGQRQLTRGEQGRVGIGDQ